MLIPHWQSVDNDGPVIKLICVDARNNCAICILKTQHETKYMLHKIYLNQEWCIIIFDSVFLKG